MNDDVASPFHNRTVVGRLQMKRVPPDLEDQTVALLDFERIQVDVSDAGLQSGLPVRLDRRAPGDELDRWRHQPGVGREDLRGSTCITPPNGRRERGGSVSGDLPFRRTTEVPSLVHRPGG